MLHFSGTNNAHFEYASSTGILTVASGTTIVSATASSYTLILTATPGGTVSSNAGTATLTVTVPATCITWAGAVTSATADADGTYSTAIAEGSAAGTTLFVVTATGSAVTYAFATDGNPGSIASSTITSGAVTLAGTLDYEATNQYVFKVV